MSILIKASCVGRVEQIVPPSLISTWDHWEKLSIIWGGISTIFWWYPAMHLHPGPVKQCCSRISPKTGDCKSLDREEWASVQPQNFLLSLLHPLAWWTVTFYSCGKSICLERAGAQLGNPYGTVISVWVEDKSCGLIRKHTYCMVMSSSGTSVVLAMVVWDFLMSLLLWELWFIMCVCV